MPPRKKEVIAGRPLALGTEVLTTAEAARDYSVSMRTISRAIKTGALIHAAGNRASFLEGQHLEEPYASVSRRVE